MHNTKHGNTGRIKKLVVAITLVISIVGIRSNPVDIEVMPGRPRIERAA